MNNVETFRKMAANVEKDKKCREMYENKQKCINWCLTNGIEYNQTST